LDEAALPLAPGCSVAQALGDGEDFEMLIALEPERVPSLLSAWSSAFPELPLTVIGRLVEPGQGESLSGGWDHFAASKD
jgi:thiamine-monophosphate kinase